MPDMFTALSFFCDKEILLTSGGQEHEVKIYLVSSIRDPRMRLLVELEISNKNLLMSRNDKEESIVGKVIFMIDLSGKPEDYIIENNETVNNLEYKTKKDELLCIVLNYLENRESLSRDLEKL